MVQPGSIFKQTISQSLKINKKKTAWRNVGSTGLVVFAAGAALARGTAGEQPPRVGRSDPSAVCLVGKRKPYCLKNLDIGHFSGKEVPVRNKRKPAAFLCCRALSHYSSLFFFFFPLQPTHLHEDDICCSSNFI